MSVLPVDVPPMLTLLGESSIATSLQDTVAFVTRPGGPVDTSKYMWAGYVVTALVYGGYAVLLKRRIARTRSGQR